MAVTPGNYLEQPTDFGALQTAQVVAHSRDFWKAARNLSFINQFSGKGDNAMIQRVTELRKTAKGNQAYITLVNDLVGDGVMGDNQLEGYEEKLTQSDCLIRFDQIRNANISGGRMTEQKQVVTFRDQSKDKLAYWCADRLDQMAFLTLSGITWDKTTEGADRPSIVAAAATGYNLVDHESATDVTGPSTKRHLIAFNDGSIQSVADGAASTDIAADATLKYKHLVRTKAYAKEKYIRGIRGKGNQEIYHVFVTPTGLADLKLDPEFRENMLHAMTRGQNNPVFSGSSYIMQDGMVIHEFRHVYTNRNAATKWGATNTTAGQRVLFCGAQALGMADIHLPNWDEQEFDYKNRPGISISKMIGFKKPKFDSIYDGTNEDFGVICLDTSITV